MHLSKSSMGKKRSRSSSGDTKVIKKEKLLLEIVKTDPGVNSAEMKQSNFPAKLEVHMDVKTMPRNSDDESMKKQQVASEDLQKVSKVVKRHYKRPKKVRKFKDEDFEYFKKVGLKERERVSKKYDNSAGTCIMCKKDCRKMLLHVLQEHTRYRLVHRCLECGKWINDRKCDVIRHKTYVHGWKKEDVFKKYTDDLLVFVPRRYFFKRERRSATTIIQSPNISEQVDEMLCVPDCTASEEEWPRDHAAMDNSNMTGLIGAMPVTTDDELNDSFTVDSFGMVSKLTKLREKQKILLESTTKKLEEMKNISAESRSSPQESPARVKHVTGNEQKKLSEFDIVDRLYSLHEGGAETGSILTDILHAHIHTLVSSYECFDWSKASEQELCSAVSKLEEDLDRMNAIHSTWQAKINNVQYRLNQAKQCLSVLRSTKVSNERQENSTIAVCRQNANIGLFERMQQDCEDIQSCDGEDCLVQVDLAKFYQNYMANEESTKQDIPVNSGETKKQHLASVKSPESLCSPLQIDIGPGEIKTSSALASLEKQTPKVPDKILDVKISSKASQPKLASSGAIVHKKKIKRIRATRKESDSKKSSKSVKSETRILKKSTETLVEIHSSSNNTSIKGISNQKMTTKHTNLGTNYLKEPLQITPGLEFPTIQKHQLMMTGHSSNKTHQLMMTGNSSNKTHPRGTREKRWSPHRSIKEIENSPIPTETLQEMKISKTEVTSPKFTEKEIAHDKKGCTMKLKLKKHQISQSDSMESKQNADKVIALVVEDELDLQRIEMLNMLNATMPLIEDSEDDQLTDDLSSSP